MNKYAYVRVSSLDQNEDRQMIEMRKLWCIVVNCSRMYGLEYRVYNTLYDRYGQK